MSIPCCKINAGFAKKNKKSINQGNPLLYDRDKAKGVIGEQMWKIKKIPLASQDQEGCAKMEVRDKKSLAVYLRHEPKSVEGGLIEVK